MKCGTARQDDPGRPCTWLKAGRLVSRSMRTQSITKGRPQVLTPASFSCRAQGCTAPGGQCSVLVLGPIHQPLGASSASIRTISSIRLFPHTKLEKPPYPVARHHAPSSKPSSILKELLDAGFESACLLWAQGFFNQCS